MKKETFDDKELKKIAFPFSLNTVMDTELGDIRLKILAIILDNRLE